MRTGTIDGRQRSRTLDKAGGEAVVGSIETNGKGGPSRTPPSDPSTKTVAHPDEQSTGINEPTTPTWNVIVADDWPDIRLLVSTLLRRSERFNVVSEVENGAEAVVTARAQRPDVLILDLSMPVMGGLQALPLVKQRSPDTKVVVLTGYDEEQLRTAALLAGADMYIDKDAMVQTLVPRLLELLGESPTPT